MKSQIIIVIAAMTLIATSCKKYLGEKPNAKLDVPTTLADFQALLDYYPIMTNTEPCSGEISSTDYYLFHNDYNGLAQDNLKRMYTWQPTNLFPLGSNEWFNTYRPVFTANTVLDGISGVKVDVSNQSDYNNVMGQALFARGRAFFKVAGLWTLQYDPSKPSQLGIVLRLTSDFNKASTRSTLQETYGQIISDLTHAAALLPVTPLQVTRASKPAAFAMLARTYLVMGNYAEAKAYADSCLQIHSTLVDYNTSNMSASYPFPKFNEEVVYESIMVGSPAISVARARIDTDLYNSYAPNDLRKVLFFKPSLNGSHVFKGSYEGNAAFFGGIATDELYLIRAECEARNNQNAAALNDLNTLLADRYITGTFIPYTTSNTTDVLSLILTERRKELLMRGLRWMDLKRYNFEGRNITLTRITNGITYTLPPNDLRYALPIPDDIIQLTGMQQNPR